MFYVDLNSDLGESFGNYTIGMDEEILQYVSSANVACGWHAGADSYAAAKSSPHLELLRKKGIEVLLLSDRIDEWMMNYLTEFDGKPFQSVSKVDESLEKLADEVDESAKEAEKALTPFIDRVKALLGERVKDVRLTHRLTDTPAIVSTDADEMSTQMAKLFAAAGQKVPEVKYIFELNPDHVLVKRAADTEDEAKFSECPTTAGLPRA